MAATWPPSLPQTASVEGYAETFGDNTIRTQMDTGPAKQRQRAEAVERPFTLRLTLTKAQVATLDAFYTTTLAGGALPFTWKHPRTGAAADFRFKESPAVAPVNNEPHIWGASLALMLQPA